MQYGFTQRWKDGAKTMREALERARALLEDVTPLNQDCGELCGRACCLPDEEGKGGVWLLPGEEEALKSATWARIIAGEVPILQCQGECDRRLRPFFCRLFPLVGIHRDGAWQVRFDRRARPLCPLTRGGPRALSPAFVLAARQAISLLGGDARYAPILKSWARIERRFSRRSILEAGYGAD